MIKLRNVVVQEVQIQIYIFVFLVKNNNAWIAFPGHVSLNIISASWYIQK